MTLAGSRQDLSLLLYPASSSMPLKQAEKSPLHKQQQVDLGSRAKRTLWEYA